MKSLRANRKTSYPATIQDGWVESSDLPSVKNYNRELYRVKAHWLVDLFPDELVIQEKTISIIRNEFLFLVSFLETIPVKDIGRVVHIETPFFSGLRIIGKNTQHELHIAGVRRSQAIKAKEIIEGLLFEDANGIEVPHWIQSDVRRERLAEAGRNPDHGEDLHVRGYLT